LTHSAVIEGRFEDAAGYYFVLADKTLEVANNPGMVKLTEKEEAAIGAAAKDGDLYWLADLYYAFSFIRDSNEKPFTSMLPEALFQVARFILNSLGKKDVPYAISRVYTLFTLAKQGKALGAFKLARYAFDRLQHLKVPLSWTNQIDTDMMTIQSKPYVDKEELLPVCFRCGATNPLINSTTGGDVCVACGHPFIRSWSSFDHLPLVEFVLKEGISDEEAISLLKTPPPTKGGGAKGGSGAKAGAEDKWKETDHGDHQTMSFGDEPPEEDDFGLGGDEDTFSQQLMNFEGGGRYTAVRVDEKMLVAMKHSEIFVNRSAVKGEAARYYRNMTPDIAITLCIDCRKFFHEEDFEFRVLSGMKCMYPTGKACRAFDWDTIDKCKPCVTDAE